ncbi:transcriptional activator hap3 [Malassezia sp. CBS 17886]|nr:transcriptional activator hap3 [Malassezia sp. CBS 17886]
MSNTEASVGTMGGAVPVSDAADKEQVVGKAADGSSTAWLPPAEGGPAGVADQAEAADDGAGTIPAGIPTLPPHAAGADLPIANISRIMKRALPENGKIAKNAKECMQECVSELISFITSEASDRCGSEKRKTINGDDILYSLRVLGFDNYEQVLKVYLSRYRHAQEENPRQRRRRSTKRRSSATSTAASNMDDSVVAENSGAVGDDGDDYVSDDAGDE